MKATIIRISLLVAISTIVVTGVLFLVLETGAIDRQIVSDNARHTVPASRISSIDTTPEIINAARVVEPQRPARSADAVEDRLTLMEKKLSILSETIQALSDQLDRESMAGLADDPSRENPDERQARRSSESTIAHEERKRALETRIHAADPAPDTAIHIRETMSQAFNETGGSFDIRNLNCTTAGCILTGFQPRDLDTTLDAELALLAFGGWSGSTSSTTNLETGEVTVYMSH